MPNFLKIHDKIPRCVGIFDSQRVKMQFLAVFQEFQRFLVFIQKNRVEEQYGFMGIPAAHSLLPDEYWVDSCRFLLVS